MFKSRIHLHTIKKISISAQLFLNYLFLLTLLLLAMIFISKCSDYVLTHYYFADDNNMSLADLIKDINIYGAKKAYTMHKLSERSYIEILNIGLSVIDEYNSNHGIGYVYPQSEFNQLVLDHSPEHILYHSDEKDTIILIHFDCEAYLGDDVSARECKFIERLYLYLILLFIISSLVVILIYAKITSKTLLRPINKILEGVTTISNGDYSTRIHYKSKNELGYLIESINKMSEKIQHEICLREISEQNRRKLIMDISHDLKTPLTNILGYAETFQFGGKIDEHLSTKYLDIIISNSNKANNLIHDLFELSHIECIACDIVFETQNFCEFIRDILVGYISQLDDKGICYDFDIPSREIMVKINSHKLERAIHNIIDNSIKYSKNNMLLKLKIEESKKHVLLTIEDTGIGIPIELVESIFDPFVRADQSRNAKTGGTGLGLAITKSIIKIHGGNIKLDTSYNNGCRLIISLPKA